VEEICLTDYFDAGATVHVAEAPARLDVMGGIADYSGSLVLEATLGETARAYVATRCDHVFHLYTLGADDPQIYPEASFPVEAFYQHGQLIDYEAAHALLTRDQLTRWSAYVLGCLYVLLKEASLPPLTYGMTILLVSSVPIGAGVASSAAIEVATMTALADLLQVDLPGLTLASLCQQVENHVVGAPCGIMDQVTCTLGEEGKLLALKCQPHDLLGSHTLPPGICCVGINSHVRHSVAGEAYTKARVAAFMGLGIIEHEADGRRYHGYLCNVDPATYEAKYRDLLPEVISGREYLQRYGETPDTVTRVDPEQTYRVRSCVEHPVYENDRVHRFLRHIQKAHGRQRLRELVAAGQLMYQSHDSYSNNCDLGCEETDLIVRLVRRRGVERGLYGAKITGGGGGGTVAVLAEQSSLQLLREIAEEYHRETGLDAEVLTGTQPGALLRGVRRMEVGASR